ncbi:MAG: OadG family protein [Synergistaceae bacterium]|jgi:hypothetical protein|nr:OadG family protein [Synergistaceae bacterium]
MNFQFESVPGGFTISVTFKDGELKLEKSEEKAQPNAVSAPAAIQASSDDDEELVAVITAAIAEFLGTDVRVVGITQEQSRSVSSWRINGWIENFEGFAD